MQNDNAPRRIIRDKEIGKKTGLSRTTRWRLERAGKFPKSVKLTEHAVGHYEDEIDAWIAARRSTAA